MKFDAILKQLETRRAELKQELADVERALASMSSLNNNPAVRRYNRKVTDQVIEVLRETPGIPMMPAQLADLLNMRPACVAQVLYKLRQRNIVVRDERGYTLRNTVATNA